jgi:hypothetical protein
MSLYPEVDALTYVVLSEAEKHVPYGISGTWLKQWGGAGGKLTMDIRNFILQRSQV